MVPNLHAEVFGKVTDGTGKHQLLLRFVEVNFPIKGSGKAFDFFSLTWEVSDGTQWIEKIVISQPEFQQDAQRRRWISRVQAFDPNTGHAILQVGEEGLRDLSGTMYVTYSWREWDLRNNRESRVIRVCEDPFEVFEVLL